MLRCTANLCFTPWLPPRKMMKSLGCGSAPCPSAQAITLSALLRIKSYFPLIRFRSRVGESVTVFISTRIFSALRKPFSCAAMIDASLLNNPILMRSSAIIFAGSSKRKAAAHTSFSFILDSFARNFALDAGDCQLPWSDREQGAWSEEQGVSELVSCGLRRSAVGRRMAKSQRAKSQRQSGDSEQFCFDCFALLGLPH